MSINHTSSDYFYLNYLQAFIPEILTSDGQIIQGHLVTDELVTNQQSKQPDSSQGRQLDWWRIRPKYRTTFSVTAKLFWQDNLLKLKIPTIPDYLLDNFRSNSFWYFNALETKTYQLRFILNTDIRETYVSGYNINQEAIERQTSSDILATPWVNLRLVQPLSTDSSAIEVDNLKFKLEKPSSVLWTTPPMEIGAKTDVHLGIHVTNNTSTAFRFYQTGSFEIILIDNYGKNINFVSDIIRLQLSHNPKYYLVKPGEHTFFDLKGMVFWNDEQLQLAIPNKSCNYFTGKEAFYYFHNLKIGYSYHLQLIYHVSELRAKRLQENSIETVWNGWIAMPLVEFCFIEP
ncbi:hypothetical protein NIES4103_28360 [Nostoc sp. NIES-4103]|nr:hypothetical protein NIES4103_28360 [Nostoc sp. NIES-4103]